MAVLSVALMHCGKKLNVKTWKLTTEFRHHCAGQFPEIQALLGVLTLWGRAQGNPEKPCARRRVINCRIRRIPASVSLLTAEELSGYSCPPLLSVHDIPDGCFGACFVSGFGCFLDNGHSSLVALRYAFWCLTFICRLNLVKPCCNCLIEHVAPAGALHHIVFGLASTPGNDFIQILRR